jgi:transcriptional regulator with XRE-family HTH domain|tara:strand:+ start:1014 stop:1502 length:489 start_codon:yes stop_codon:yes gene_type:complete
MTRNEQIKELRKQGLTYQAIGDKFNISKNRAWQIIHNIDYYTPRHIIKFRKLTNKKYRAFLKKKFRKVDTRLTLIHDYGEGRLNKIREIVRMRDNFLCQLCGFDWKLKKQRRLDVHHLDEDRDGHGHKGACKWDSEHTDRMITVCHKCHLNLDISIKKMRKE